MEDPPELSSPPPFKKRKFYRKRTGYEDEMPDSASITESQSPPPQTELLTLDEMISRNSGASPLQMQELQNVPLSLAELLRQRKALQRRRGGIGFANTSTTTGETLPTAQIKNVEPEEQASPANFVTVADRFAPQTGQVADVDQHMMAYIDSELAKRRQGQNTVSHASHVDGFGGQSASDTIDAAVRRQPAALGKLHEIDLGPDATLTNIARTEAARRRLEDGAPEVEEEVGKVRLGRDGKPRRNRRRRNSDDIKRDKLVEEVMKESKIDIYDEPEGDNANDDQAADDRIAEQFRREFMDAVAQRRQKTSQTSKKTGQGAVEDSHKGPKLGGSRSARAAMRELQEKAKKK
ncbi:MAG: hypothetical protein Q9195_000023 [Heterodermia aff. obscurata]